MSRRQPIEFWPELISRLPLIVDKMFVPMEKIGVADRGKYADINKMLASKKLFRSRSLPQHIKHAPQSHQSEVRALELLIINN